MYYNHTINNNINSLHERCLRIVYNHKIFSLAQLPEKGSFVSIHHVIVEIKNELSPSILNELSNQRANSYNARHF